MIKSYDTESLIWYTSKKWIICKLLIWYCEKLSKITSPSFDYILIVSLIKYAIKNNKVISMMHGKSLPPEHILEKNKSNNSLIF